MCNRPRLACGKHMGLRPDEKEKRSFKLPEVVLPDWSMAVLFTVAYAVFLEWILYRCTGGRTLGSGFVMMNVSFVALFGWVPSFIAWSVWNDHRRFGRRR